MRLKHNYRAQQWNTFAAMNQKNLNYEIETIMTLIVTLWRSFAMNQKNLNYEIETHLPSNQFLLPFMSCYSYESKESQL